MFDRRRYDHPEMPVDAGQDDLQLLLRVGVRAVVCLLNSPALASIYANAGIDCHLSPIPDGHIPDLGQFIRFVRFVEEQRALAHPVAVHCAAGLGRTGTMLAGYLITQGDNPETAVRRVRAVQRGAIETRIQMDFLVRLPGLLAGKRTW